MLPFRERLSVPWWAWLVAASGPLMLGVAYGYAISTPVGWLVAAALAILLVTSLLRTAPVIEVTKEGLRAGRAFLESPYLGEVTVLGTDEARRLRGVGADARAYTLVRGWLPGAVRLDVDDDRDPTPYWYLSTRKPEALAKALVAAGSAAAPAPQRQVGRPARNDDVEGFGSDGS